MKILRRNKEHFKIGLPPGALVYTGEQSLQKVEITIISYDQEDVYEEKITYENLAEHLVNKKRVFWIDIVGLHDVDLLEKMGLDFGLHRLTMEDVVSIDQRPKLEVFDEYVIAILKMMQCLSTESEIDEEQISFILKDGILITFQERPGDVFQFVRTRILENRGSIRKRKADYLLYALLDAVVDNYFVVLENIGEKIESLENQAMEDPSTKTLGALYQQRRQLMELRRTIYPIREVIGGIEKNAEHKISKDTKPFLRDLYENTIQVIETMEVFRDMSSGVLDLYMNSLSNRMNNVMKVLTIISTIFIPLSFVAGVYGMNFEYMPELTWRYGYFYVLAGMGIAILGMLGFFWWKKWL